jgi:hypothetical protein
LIEEDKVNGTKENPVRVIVDHKAFTTTNIAVRAFVLLILKGTWSKIENATK